MLEVTFFLGYLSLCDLAGQLSGLFPYGARRVGTRRAALQNDHHAMRVDSFGRGGVRRFQPVAQVGSEWVGEEILLCASLVRFQGIIENK